MAGKATKAKAESAKACGVSQFSARNDPDFATLAGPPYRPTLGNGGNTLKHTLLLAALLSSFSAPVLAATLCPDGQYHADGTCKLCPDGTYTTAPRCALAPDGNYLPDYGRGSKLAPDGRYIPNTGSMVLCSDGNYYPGRSCRLLPDSRYIGSQ